MSAAAPKKQVRFARTEQSDGDGDNDNNDDQEEDTLFDKRQDAQRGSPGLRTGARRRDELGSEEVAVRGSRTGGQADVSRWPVTAVLCASFLGLGMSIAVLGPTLEDLAINVNKNISNISYIFVGRALGYIGGSVVAGVLFDCVNHYLLLGFSMLATAFGMFAVPFCKKPLLLTALMCSVGVSMGFLDTGGNVLILSTWGAQSGPHMQALHFSFAAGAVVSPVLAKLLLGAAPPAGRNVSAGAAPHAAGHISKALSPPLGFAQGRGGSLKSTWAYTVIGIFVLLVSLFFLILYSRSSPSRERAKASSETRVVSRHHNALILLLFFFFFCYVGAEVAYGSFIFTYAKDFAGMDKSEAAGLNSVFWATFAAVRGLAIFFAACLPPGAMILLSLVGCTVSSLFLTLFSRSRAALWAGSAVYGASMATTFPSGISWVEQYTTVTGRSAAVFVVGAALGEMVIPAVVGFLLGQTRELPVLMYTALGTSTMTAIIFPVMYKLATSQAAVGRKPREGGRAGDDGEDRKALLDSGANEEEDEDGEEEGDEAEQWNDADFEVIEMDDAGLVGSPPPASAGAGGTAAAAALPASPSHPAGRGSPSPAFPAGSPRRKLLLSLDREKKD
ncbi:sodium-dependent glucose transporter 1 [Lepisosteus oculatus]|uniref:sodium-dependent glucose transporter 1 n=1 Tax=Lepisosteus oculatus TaxID=7918 RepID=UPI0035F50B38